MFKKLISKKNKSFEQNNNLRKKIKIKYVIKNSNFRIKKIECQKIKSSHDEIKRYINIRLIIN